MSKPEPAPAELPAPQPTFGDLDVVGVDAHEPVAASTHVPFHRQPPPDEDEDTTSWVRMMEYVKQIRDALMEKPDLIRSLFHQGYRARELLALNFTPEQIMDQLEVTSANEAKEVGFTPPLDAEVWALLCTRCELQYVQLDSVFGLQNLEQYMKEGLSPLVLSKHLHVTIDMLLRDNRVNVPMMRAVSADAWFDMGMRWRHMSMLRSPIQVIAQTLGLTLEELEEKFQADGTYVTSPGPDGHQHRVEIVDGEVIVMASGVGDHIHLVSNGVIVENDRHTHAHLTRDR